MGFTQSIPAVRAALALAGLDPTAYAGWQLWIMQFEPDLPGLIERLLARTE
jgi:hypothetical protein